MDFLCFQIVKADIHLNFVFLKNSKLQNTFNNKRKRFLYLYCLTSCIAPFLILHFT